MQHDDRRFAPPCRMSFRGDRRTPFSSASGAVKILIGLRIIHRQFRRAGRHSFRLRMHGPHEPADWNSANARVIRVTALLAETSPA